jgi:predicted RNA polymerase sigma factor
MAINKKNSPLWVKAVIIFVAITFVASIALVGFSGFGGGATPTKPTGATGTLAAQYQPQVDSALAASKADPTNATLLANVGHVYYEWAVAEYENGAVELSRPHWTAAVAYYDQALAITPGDVVVLGNKAFALTYANSPDAKAALEAFIATNAPTLAEQIANAKQLLAEIIASESTAASSTPASTTP